MIFYFGLDIHLNFKRINQIRLFKR